MVSYCPPNITISQVWIDHSFSKCFIETLSNVGICGFLLIFGTIQLYIYRKYAIETPQELLRSSKLYKSQVLLHYFAMLLAIVRFILQGTILNDKHLYGYMIVSVCLNMIMYSYAIGLLICEKKYLLPSVPTRGHGLILLIFWSCTFFFENLSFVNLNQKSWWFHLTSLSDQLEMSLFILRYTTCLFIFILGLKAPGILTNNEYYTLNYDATFNPSPTPNVEQGSTFRNVWKKIKTLMPFLWPKKDVFLQFRVVICFGLLIAGRAINLYTPIYGKYLLNSINEDVFRWDYIIIFCLFKFLQGSGVGTAGLLNNLRTFLWIKVQQYTTREIEVELFRHLHSLSLRWHLNRKSGEVLRVMDRGTDSINNLLSTLLFNIFPILVDIVVAVVYFLYFFNVWFGLLVFVTMILYILATIMVTEWRTKFHRLMNLADNATKARAVDSLLNFETVKYYGAEAYEVDAYREAILKYQVQEWKAMFSLNILNTVQNVIIVIGLFIGTALCVYMVVVKHTLNAGDYFLFATYIIQLYMPLNWFGTYYRITQRNFIDMENMFDLLKEQQEVIDPPNAPNLIIKKGQVDFIDVSFGYTPERIVLKDVSFTIPPGNTVALVGPSGSGKSTIMRLLFRFYDLNEGAILVDGQNIKTVSQSSLRKEIGVVPQDTVLFNNTIMYNINYGNVSASEADVISAAESADIHKRILTFPDGYETQVGERGLRLSGGEKQRVAIARTMLKSPTIILLDEATSALDTQTERNIQAALHRICANRTTLIIAHRLSTIIHADEILVLKEGSIVERGTHELLLEANGVYAQMWEAQLKNSDQVEPAESSSQHPTEN